MAPGLQANGRRFLLVEPNAAGQLAFFEALSAAAHT